jgi:hypothetical protein
VSATEILLAEYQCAEANRDHYDSTRWTIGSIFIIASLTALAATFIEPILRMFRQTVVLVLLSAGFYLVFLAYDHHVVPYVKMSINRMQRIERELQLLHSYVSPLPDKELELFEKHKEDPKRYPLINSIPRLHTMIQKVAPEGRGKMILYALTLLLVSAWIGRLMLFLPK